MTVTKNAELWEMEIASFMEVRAASACTNACNLQTEERADE